MLVLSVLNSISLFCPHCFIGTFFEQLCSFYDKFKLLHSAPKKTFFALQL